MSWNLVLALLKNIMHLSIQVLHVDSPPISFNCESQQSRYSNSISAHVQSLEALPTSTLAWILFHRHHPPEVSVPVLLIRWMTHTLLSQSCPFLPVYMSSQTHICALWGASVPFITRPSDVTWCIISCSTGMQKLPITPHVIFNCSFSRWFMGQALQKKNKKPMLYLYNLANVNGIKKTRTSCCSCHTV